MTYFLIKKSIDIYFLIFNFCVVLVDFVLFHVSLSMQLFFTMFIVNSQYHLFIANNNYVVTFPMEN